MLSWKRVRPYAWPRELGSLLGAVSAAGTYCLAIMIECLYRYTDYRDVIASWRTVYMYMDCWIDGTPCVGTSGIPRFINREFYGKAVGMKVYSIYD